VGCRALERIALERRAGSQLGRRVVEREGRRPMGLYCGIDWAEHHHDVAVVDEAGQVLARFRIGTPRPRPRPPSPRCRQEPPAPRPTAARPLTRQPVPISASLNSVTPHGDIAATGWPNTTGVKDQPTHDCQASPATGHVACLEPTDVRHLGTAKRANHVNVYGRTDLLVMPVTGRWLVRILAMIRSRSGGIREEADPDRRGG
jgi:hypothetical protein